MNHKKGFSLTELLVVVTIIILLVTIVLGALSGNRAKARDAKRIDDIRTFQAALEFYYNKYRMYPCGDANDDTAAHYAPGFDPANRGTMDSSHSCPNPTTDPNAYGFLNGTGGVVLTSCVGPYQTTGLFTEGLLPTNCPRDPGNNDYSPGADNQLYIYQATKDRQSYLLSAHLESNKAAMIDDGGLCADAYEVGPLVGSAIPVWPGEYNNCTPNPSL